MQKEKFLNSDGLTFLPYSCNRQKNCRINLTLSWAILVIFNEQFHVHVLYANSTNLYV